MLRNFEECVKKEREKGAENPELNAMLRFILYGEDIEC